MRVLIVTRLVLGVVPTGLLALARSLLNGTTEVLTRLHTVPRVEAGVLSLGGPVDVAHVGHPILFFSDVLTVGGRQDDEAVARLVVDSHTISFIYIYLHTTLLI